MECIANIHRVNTHTHTHTIHPSSCAHHIHLYVTHTYKQQMYVFACIAFSMNSKTIFNWIECNRLKGLCVPLLWLWFFVVECWHYMYMYTFQVIVNCVIYMNTQISNEMSHCMSIGFIFLRESLEIACSIFIIECWWWKNVYAIIIHIFAINLPIWRQSRMAQQNSFSFDQQHQKANEKVEKKKWKKKVIIPSVLFQVIFNNVFFFSFIFFFFQLQL